MPLGAVSELSSGSGEDSLAGRRATRETIRREILRRLYSGEYKPGQRLTEAHLTESFGVSRSTVREALNLLAANGVVILSPQRGAQIHEPSVQEAINTAVVAQHLVGLVCKLAALAIHRPGAAEIIRQALRDVVESSVQGHVEGIGSRERFYERLITVSGNDVLRRALAGLHFQLIPIQYPVARNIIERYSVPDLRRVAEAILEGSPVTAQRAAERYVGRAIEALKLLQPMVTLVSGSI